MGIEATHPEYDELHDDWIIMCDTYEGQRKVKERTVSYLPPTTGMVADGMQSATAPGMVAYAAYLSRARFPDVVKPTVEGMVGIMHRKPPEILLPNALEPLREAATPYGESLEVLLRKINEEQLRFGRLGLLVDVPQGDANVFPFINVYSARCIRNWDDSVVPGTGVRKLNFVVLDQSGYKRSDSSSFKWTYVDEYLLVSQFDQAVEYQLYGKSESKGPSVIPSLGGRTFERIPFVFINAMDLTPLPDKPPLLPLANEALAVYRLDADYRQALFMQGQDTLVVIGASPEGEYRVGAGAAIVLEDPNADAKYIGVSSEGLGEVREAHAAGYEKLAEMGSTMLRTRGADAESGDALRIRVAARTASIVGIVRAGAKGLEDALKYCAMLKGANPDEVVVKPNMDFTEDMFSAKELLDYASAKRMGAPVSWKTIHSILKQKEVTELDYEEELDQIAEEELNGVGAPSGSSGGTGDGNPSSDGSVGGPAQ